MRTSRDFKLKRVPNPHRYHWVIEALSDQPSFIQKPMFGCQACYLHGRLVLVLAANNPTDWQGLLIPTERSYHRALRREFSSLVVHPVLKKWLYLPEASEAFEEIAEKIVGRILAKDCRIGVESARRL